MSPVSVEFGSLTTDPYKVSGLDEEIEGSLEIVVIVDSVFAMGSEGSLASTLPDVEGDRISLELFFSNFETSILFIDLFELSWISVSVFVSGRRREVSFSIFSFISKGDAMLSSGSGFDRMLICLEVFSLESTDLLAQVSGGVSILSLGTWHATEIGCSTFSDTCNAFSEVSWTIVVGLLRISGVLHSWDGL